MRILPSFLLCKIHNSLIRLLAYSRWPPLETDRPHKPQLQDSPAKEIQEELARFPRSLQTLHLQPLRRETQYGIPSCDLQLRAYSARPIEFFSDFALRAAYYLGLPAFGPTPLPRIVQRWTVPRSHFIFKKSQENYERITLRRLIQIRDGNPETVQIWLAFLQKHAYPGVGMKANMWEFGALGEFACSLILPGCSLFGWHNWDDWLIEVITFLQTRPRRWMRLPRRLLRTLSRAGFTLAKRSHWAVLRMSRRCYRRRESPWRVEGRNSVIWCKALYNQSVYMYESIDSFSCCLFDCCT